MKSPFIFLFLCLSLALQSQTWDYVNFTDGNKNINNACIDHNDYVYTVSNHLNRFLRQFDPTGGLVWEKDISSLLSSYAYTGLGGIDFNGSDLYIGGKHSSNNKGVIIESGLSAGDLPLIWDQINCVPSTTHCRVNDVKAVDNHLYVVGSFGGNGTPTTISFFDGTTLSANQPSTFIAKYSISPKALIWAERIQAINATGYQVTAEDLDLDDEGNIFISGQFRGGAFFYDAGVPNFFSSSDPTFLDAFLAKFDNNGNFDTSFSLKTRAAAGGSRFSYDVDVSNDNEAVYWSEQEYIVTYKKDGTGIFLWDKHIPGSKTYSIEANHCGEVYVTGRTSTTLLLKAAPCGSDYFALSLAHSDGSTIWSSTATSCDSYGAEVLIDTDNKEVIVGTYYGSGEVMTIDTDYSSSNTRGYFIGRYDDYPVNSCCKDIPDFDLPNFISVCDANYETLCGPVSTLPSPIYTYQWSSGGDVLSTSRCFTPTAPGTYTLTVTDQNGCVFTHTVSILPFVPLVPELRDLYWCEALPTRLGWLTDPFTDFPCELDFEWTYNGSTIVGADSYNTPYIGDGTYCVTVSSDFFSVTRCFEVSQCCEPETTFSVSWTPNGDGSYALEVENIDYDFYVSETYYLEKDCNNDGTAGPWTYVDEITRTTDFDLPVVFSPLDPNCLYRITHRVPSPCKMKVYVHTEYVGGSPGLVEGETPATTSKSDTFQPSMTVAPNPTNGLTTIYIDDLESDYQLQLYNLQGRLLESVDTVTPRTEIDLGGLPAGIYLLKASNGTDHFTQRVVKL